MEATAVNTQWSVDPTHSEVQFKVRHLVISTVTGFFKKFDGTIEQTGEDFDGAKATFAVSTASVDTNMADRDGHLRSEEFFDSEKFENMTFEGTFTKKDEDTYKVNGNLTIKGNSKPVELTAEYGGTMVDGYGQTKSGFEITGKINRKEFGLNWSAVTEAGGVVVGDDVKLHLNLQFVKK